MRSLIQTLKVIVLALVIGLGANYLYAQSVFTAPTDAPPAGNPAAPVNVGSAFQTKTGPFDVKGQMFVHALNPSNGQPYVTGFSVLNGNVGIGTANPSVKLQVIGAAKADDFCLTDGSKCLSGTGAGGVTKIVAGTGVTVSPASGTGEVTVNSNGGVDGLPTGFKSTVSCGPFRLGAYFGSPTATKTTLYYSYTNGTYYFYSAFPMIGRSESNAAANAPTIAYHMIQGYDASGNIAPGQIGYGGGNGILSTLPGGFSNPNNPFGCPATSK
jgi:hypothetical protein